LIASLFPGITGYTHEIGRWSSFFMKKWVVDGMNVVGSTPDGWWRDRQGAMRRLAERLSAFAADSGEPVTVVFDGRPFELDTDDIEVVFAPRPGRNAADDEIARMVAGDPDPGSLTVVTSDRELSKRVASSGAEVVPSRAFRARLI
jgi:predicted RNA-binding protein with PIN domain